MKRALITLAFTLSLGSSTARAQAASAFVPLDTAAVPAALASPVTLSLDRVALRDAVAAIAKQASISFTFDPSLAGLDRKVTLHVAGVPAATALFLALENTPLHAVVSASSQIVIVPRPAPPPARAPLEGTVHNTEIPLGGARLELVGTRFTAVSRDDGSFTFGVVSAGDYTMRVLRIGYRPLVREHVIVPPGADCPKLEVEIEAAPVPLNAVIVTPGYFGILQPSLMSAHGLSRQQIETVPQIGDDIYRAVTRLPGVSSNDYSAKFSVRGGNGDELYVTLDGLALVEPFHLKDIASALSIIDSKALGSAELTTGGPSVEFGDQLAGVFSMRSLDPQTDQARVAAGISVMNARLMSQGGFANGNGAWLVSARRGYLDLAMKLAGYTDSIVPRYDDLFAKLQYKTPDGGRLAVHVLHSDDHLTYLDGPPSPGIRSSYGSDYGWITWDGYIGSRLRQQSVLSVGALSWHRFGTGYDSDTTTLETAFVQDNRRMTTRGLRQDWTLALSRGWLTKFGFDAKHETATYDYRSVVRHQDIDHTTKIIFGRFDSTQVEAQPTSNRLGAYVAQRVRPFAALTLEGGLRYDRATHTGDETLDPRFNAAWELSPRTTIRAGWGRHSQSQAIFALDAADGINTFSPAEREEERVMGVEQTLPFGIAARIEGYDRLVHSPRPRFLNTIFKIQAFPELNDDRIRFDPDLERARGLEFSFARDVGTHVDWSASYALVKFTDRIHGRTIPSPTDQRHTVHADWGYRPSSNKWRLTVAGVWHTGWPYTPQVTVIDTILQNQNGLRWFESNEPGELFMARVPAYKRLDARWTRYFEARGSRVSLFVEIFNLLNNRNVGSFHNYSAWQGRISVLRASDDQVPRLPTFGITWEF